MSSVREQTVQEYGYNFYACYATNCTQANSPDSLNTSNDWHVQARLQSSTWHQHPCQACDLGHLRFPSILIQSSCFTASIFTSSYDSHCDASDSPSSSKVQSHGSEIKGHSGGWCFESVIKKTWLMWLLGGHQYIAELKQSNDMLICCLVRDIVIR